MSNNPTHFLRGVELITEAHKEFKLCTENWCSPTRFNYGNPQDLYYAEIWYDGMDWNKNYWIIESANLNNPVVQPILHFDDHSKEEKMIETEELLTAIMDYRRNTLWIKHDDLRRFSETIWPYIRKINPEEKLGRCPIMVKHRILHASQPRTEFYLNINLIPEQKPISNKIEISEIKIETQYPIEEPIQEKGLN